MVAWNGSRCGPAISVTAPSEVRSITIGSRQQTVMQTNRCSNEPGCAQIRLIRSRTFYRNVRPCETFLIHLLSLIGQYKTGPSSSILDSILDVRLVQTRSASRITDYVRRYETLVFLQRVIIIFVMRDMHVLYTHVTANLVKSTFSRISRLSLLLISQISQISSFAIPFYREARMTNDAPLMRNSPFA